ncbi:MAG TPA: P-loop NTPase [Firmicutes bacterium]|nr:P-loop NTPase [Candidatus Fermentithermobacillaceae bacterium]
MTERTSVLIAGNSRSEQAVRQKRPDAKIVGVLKDLALVEYVSSEMIVDEIVIDGQMAPRGETLEQWISRYNKAFPQVSVTVVGENPGQGISQPSATKVITSQTVVVWSPKGGVGKTFISANLACAAAMATQGKAVLLDLDVCSGDVATYLDLADGPTIVEMLPELPRLRPDGLDRYTQKHASSRLNVICSPRRPEFSNLISVEHVRHLLSLAARRWGLLYVDTAPDITSDILGEVIEAASAVVLVITQDVCALRQGKVALDIFGKLGIQEESVHIVLNRGSKDAPISESKVEEYLEKRLAAVVPDDRKTVEKSVFQGRPVTLSSRTEIASAIWRLLSGISPGLPLPDTEKRQKKTRRLRFW